MIVQIIKPCVMVQYKEYGASFCGECKPLVNTVRMIGRTFFCWCIVCAKVKIWKMGYFSITNLRCRCPSVTSVCCFVLLNRYRGFATVPGFPRGRAMEHVPMKYITNVHPRLAYTPLTCVCVLLCFINLFWPAFLLFPSFLGGEYLI